MGKKYVLQRQQQIDAMENAKLLEEVLEMAGGDDYDGCFTDEGRIIYEYAVNVLKNRLSEWLKEN